MSSDQGLSHHPHPPKFFNVSPIFHLRFIKHSSIAATVSNVMNEQTTANNDHPVINQCATQTKRAATRVKGWGGPAISVISYGLIIGFALTGIGVMMLSSLVWLLFGISSFSGFGLLTGGLFLSAATALFLGKLTKAGDSLYANRRKQRLAA